jgi:hypothetical protein
MSREWQLDSLAEESRDLFRALDTEFGVGFDKSSFSLDCLIEPPQNHMLFSGNTSIDPSANWGLTAGYIPGLDALGFTRLQLRQRNGKELVFVRPLSRPSIFLLFEHTDNAERLLCDQKENVFALTSGQMTTLLDKADISLPMIFTDNASTQQAVFDLKEKALTWRSYDRRVLPLGVDRQLVVERSYVVYPVHEKHIVQAHVVLRALKERIMPNGNRHQVVVVFVGKDYLVSEPTIYGRVLRLDSPKYYNSEKDDYTTTETFTPNIDPLELIRRIAEVILQCQTSPRPRR